MTVPTRNAPTYRLVREMLPPPEPPALDDAQRAVLEHPGGPLLVLAGPGTGKTTTLVEAVAARVARGTAPERLLVLTFSRRAAQELRDRIGRRLGRTTAGPAACTFHSFCHALLLAHRHPEAHHIEPGGRPLRLLSGPEQEVAVRELLRGTAVDDPTRWPPVLAACLTTRGLAEEVRDVLARACERDVDLARLAAEAATAGQRGPAALWRALARFATEYGDVLDARGVLDHAELIRRAVALAESAPVRAQLRDRYDAVFVDEYQDTDPAQVRLIQAVAGDGRDLVVFGDPDQSIYAFRGADVRGIGEFTDTFRDRAGRPADTAVLRYSRRAVPALLAASRAVAARLPLAGLPVDAARAHRDLFAVPLELPAAERPMWPARSRAAEPAAGQEIPPLAVLTFDSVGAELGHVADALRRAHLAEGIPWSDMAVLVRSGTATIPAVRRVLGAAGIPLEVAADEVPLRAEPAVTVLLAALRAAADPSRLTAETARTLLLSPLARVDPADLRRLGRELRAAARTQAGDPAASADLIAEAVREPERLAGARSPAAAPARRLGELLAAARATLAAGGSAEEALWEIWSGTPWAARLAAAAAGSGPAARRAHRDLDAACALFAAAARAEEQAGPRGVSSGVANFLAEIGAQQIPGERPVAAERGAAVRVMTAHRSKGLEWPLVAVVGVQEGRWPDLRRRGSLLGADRLRPDGLSAPPTPASMLAEERRLFYVAITRARRRLLVTAVDRADEDGERPSRFLAELGVPVVPVRSRPARPFSLTGLVAELRAVLLDPATSPPLRSAAAARLAELAECSDASGDALVPAADPRRWWGVADPTRADAPLRDPADPIELSGSAVDGLAACPLQWFLRREVHADSAATAASGFGNVLHALAEEVAAGAPADLDALMMRLDSVWSELTFDAGWRSTDEREAARDALARFLAWHAGRPDRRLLGVEVPFDVEIAIGKGADAGGSAGGVPSGDPGDGTEGGSDGGPGGGERVRVRGRFDRVELDAAGRVRVVDLKSNRTKPSTRQVAGHPQLGVYQEAVAAGALAHLPGAGTEAGGAELVMLRHPDGTSGLPRVYGQDPPAQADDPRWVLALLTEAARRLRAEAFTPLPDEDCERCGFRRCCTGRPEGRQVIE